MLWPMNELALQQQRTVDRIALIGSALAILAATAFVALDPVQTVARRGSSAATGSSLPTVAPAAPDRSPLAQLALPSPAWTIVSDGTWAAYARLDEGQPAEIVVRALHSDASRVVYRAHEASYLGQLSLAKGVLALEEILPGNNGQGREISVRVVNVATGDVTTMDTFAPSSSLAASPVTDGSRLFWVRPNAAGGDEIRGFDLATSKAWTVQRRPEQIAALALSGNSLAYTAFARDASASYVLDLASGAAKPVDGFAYSYVQSVAPDGVVVTGALAAGAPASSWLVRSDGARTRLASDCFNVTMTARVLAMRCATQIEIRDLATGASLYHFAGNAGALAVFEGGVVWGEGDELMLYELPALARATEARPN
jgi:hypothetical protein